MKVAISGAGGYVGQLVNRHLTQAGLQTSAQYHRRGAFARRQPAAQRIYGDLNPDTQGRKLARRLLRGQSALVHCAFSHAPYRYRQGEGDDPIAFWHDNLLTTIALLEAAIDCGLDRVLLLSSRAVFDGRSATDVPLADDASTCPTTHYGALKVAEEALARRYSQETSLAVTAIRITGVYGVVEPLPRTKWYAEVAALLQQDQVPAPRAATQVHGDDVAAAALCLIRAPAEAVRGRSFNCSDQTISHRDLVRQVARTCGQRWALPEQGITPGCVMGCPGLEALGWRGGGQSRFEATVDDLVARLRAARSADAAGKGIRR